MVTWKVTPNTTFDRSKILNNFYAAVLLFLVRKKIEKSNNSPHVNLYRKYVNFLNQLFVFLFYYYFLTFKNCDTMNYLHKRAQFMQSYLK